MFCTYSFLDISRDKTQNVRKMKRCRVNYDEAHRNLCFLGFKKYLQKLDKKERGRESPRIRSLLDYLPGRR